MPDDANPLHTLIQCTRRCCSFLSGVVCSLVSRRCTDLVCSPFGASNKLPLKKGNNLTVMAARETIDIDSSDSESWDLTEYKELNKDLSPSRDSGDSASVRVLPPSITGVNRNQTGPRNHEFPPLERPSYSNGSSSRADQHTEDYKKHAPPLSSTRTLPLSLQPAMHRSRSRNTSETASSSQTHDRGKSHSYAWPDISSISSSSSRNPTSHPNAWSDISSSSRNPTRDHFGRTRDDAVIFSENNGTNRMLPPSLMPGKSMAPAPYMGSIDQMPRPGFNEERTVGSDERLIYQAALQDLNQPKLEATLPDGLLSVSLLRHQKIALAWMLQKETSSLHCCGGILADDQGLGKTISTIALVQMQRHLQSKSKSDSQSSCKAEALNLDDDDDNGSDSLNKNKLAITDSNNSELKPEVTTSVPEFNRRRPAAGTLVVCPASVLRQWAREMDDKVAEEAKLSVLIYHGGNRTRDPVELAKYDVVLTTYAIVTNEVPKQPLVDEDDDDHKNEEKYGLSSEFSMNRKRKKPATVNKKGKKGKKGIDSSAFDSDCGTLARVGWLRVVLDEAQTIKNHRTQVARACCGLRAKRRWCLSGTPIQNAVDELYSYFRFLKYDPYAVYKSFCSTIKYPIARNSSHGYKKLQAVLRAIMLRRTKGTLLDGEPIICLPPKKIELAKVEFSQEERAFYTKLETDSRLKFKAYAAAGTVSQNYANILLMLLRLRQACDHPLLVKEFSLESADPVGKESLEMAKKLPTDMLVNLLELLETSNAICRLCSDPPEDGVVTMCGHVFCYQCVSDYLTGDENTCPVPGCKEQLGADVVFSKFTLESCISTGNDSNGSSSSDFPDKATFQKNEYSSSKIKAALKILEAHCKPKSLTAELYELEHFNGSSSYSAKDADTGPFKAIVFSQWTSMLDLVECALSQTSLKYRRLDGTMSLVSRDRAVKDFNTNPEVTVMLMSLKAGNLGLNMVAASRVILLDLWWNPATEDQAIDRAHRIGQTRAVTVSRITVKDTVEDRILALQDDKRKMVASAFGEDQTGGTVTRLTVEDLRYLFMV